MIMEVVYAAHDAIVAGVTQAHNINMRNEDGSMATMVPKELLQASKGKDVDVVLEMDDYSWKINGDDIAANDLTDINLEVDVDAENIPDNKVNELAGDLEAHQLALTHNGEFGFKADLTINLGAGNKGKYGELYYYNKDGKLEYMGSGVIDERGNVDLSFSHASDYVVLIDEEAGDNNLVEDDTNNGGSNQNPGGNDTNNGDVNGGEAGEAVPETGDNTNISLYYAILFAGVALTVLSMKKRRFMI